MASKNGRLNPPEDAFTKGFGYVFGILLSLILAEYVTGGLIALGRLYGLGPQQGLRLADTMSINTGLILFPLIFLIGLSIILNQTIETFLWTLARPDDFEEADLLQELGKFAFHLLGIISLYAFVAIFTRIYLFSNIMVAVSIMAATFLFMNFCYSVWGVIYEIQYSKDGMDLERENLQSLVMNISFCIIWLTLILIINSFFTEAETSHIIASSGLLVIIMLLYQIVYLRLWYRWYVQDLLALESEEPVRTAM